MRNLPLLLILSCTLVLGSSTAEGQQYLWEIGVKGGIANYFGDLQKETGTNSFKVYQENTRWSGGFFVRKRINYRFAYRFDLSYSRISGADSLNPESDRTTRNLHFRSDIIEASGRFEFYPLIIDDVGWKRRFLVDFHFVTFIGAGVFYNNPQAQYNGDWVNLRPLKTEGRSYSPAEPCFPMGFGAFFTFSDGNSKIRRHRLGIEVSYRLLFTDYLDDVSDSYPEHSQIQGETARDLYYRTWELHPEQSNPQNRSYPRPGKIRGNPDDDDAFATIMIKYSYVLRTHVNGRYRPKYNYIYGNSIRSKRKRNW